MNWDDLPADSSDGSGTSSIIFENTLANIEVACSYGSRTVPLDTTDNEPGSGGYRSDAITGTSNEPPVVTPFQTSGSGTVYGEIMNISGRRDKFGFPSIGLGGDKNTVSEFSVTDDSFYSSDPPTSFSSFVSGTLTLRMGHYGEWVDFRRSEVDFIPYAILDIYFMFVDSIQCGDGRSWSWGEDGVASSSQYDSYDLTLNGQEELDDNRKIEIEFGESATLCLFTVKRTLISDNLQCEAEDYFLTTYYLRAATDIDCYVYASQPQTGYYYFYFGDDFFGYTKMERNDGQLIVDGTEAQNAARHKNGIEVNCAGICEDPDGEWKSAECDTAAERYRSGFESNCRWIRRRFYDRIKTSLLQDHTLPTNVFPDYNINGGYQGDNLLRTLGFINFVDHNDVFGSSTFYETNTGAPDLSVSESECKTYGDTTSGVSWYAYLQSSDRPCGCLKLNTNQIWYNQEPSCGGSHQCSLSGHHCVQKINGPLHISYDKVTHISYDHNSIMPLFDVGTNDDDFDTTDLSLTDFRARQGANSFEYCSGSTTQRSAPFLPTSCDDLGYPFVIDSAQSVSGTEKICMKVDDTNTKCCIGPDCTGSPIPRCMDTASYSGLSAVSYEVSQYLSFDTNNADFIVEHSENDQDVALAYAKDRCSQLGEFCLLGALSLLGAVLVGLALEGVDVVLNGCTHASGDVGQQTGCSHRGGSTR